MTCQQRDNTLDLMDFRISSFAAPGHTALAQGNSDDAMQAESASSSSMSGALIGLAPFTRHSASSTGSSGSFRPRGSASFAYAPGTDSSGFGTGSLPDSSKTGSGFLPSNFKDSTVTCIPRFVPFHELKKPIQSNEGLNELMDTFGFPDGQDSWGAIYNPNLSVDGLTTRDEDIEIGPSAFASNLRTSGIGARFELSDGAIGLHVALTIAHELTHVNQFKEFPMVDLQGKESRMASLDPEARSKIEKARNVQVDLLEALGYHSEVLNLQPYIDAIDINTPADEESQIIAMKEAARHHRDEHFNNLPIDIAALVLSGDIRSAMRETVGEIPMEFVHMPCAAEILPGVQEEVLDYIHSEIGFVTKDLYIKRYLSNCIQPGFQSPHADEINRLFSELEIIHTAPRADDTIRAKAAKDHHAAIFEFVRAELVLSLFKNLKDSNVEWNLSRQKLTAVVTSRQNRVKQKLERLPPPIQALVLQGKIETAMQMIVAELPAKYVSTPLEDYIGIKEFIKNLENLDPHKQLEQAVLIIKAMDYLPVGTRNELKQSIRNIIPPQGNPFFW